MPHFRPLLLCLACCILAAPALFGQRPTWRNYTTADGLPSNEIYGMCCDQRGFLWFATDLGVCRFDGYDFRRPVDTSAFASSAAFKMAEDAQGRVWFNRLDASIWLVENDTIRRWQHNHLIEQYRPKFFNLGYIAVEKTGAVWVQLPRLGILVVQPEGSHQLLRPQDFGFVFARVGDRTIYSISNLVKEIVADIPVFRWQNQQMRSVAHTFIGTDRTKKGSSGVWPLRNGDFLLHHLQTFYLLRDDQILWQGTKNVGADDIFEDRDGTILLSSLSGPQQGLLRFRSLDHFKRDEFVNLLPDQQVVSALRDQEGGWWAATANSGVFYCKNPYLETFDQSNGLPSDDAQSITSDGQQRIFVAFRNGKVCAIRRRERQVEMLPPPPAWNQSDRPLLRFDAAAQRLWFASNLCFWNGQKWQNATYQNFQKWPSQPISLKKITASRSNGLWWASSFSGFFSIDPLHSSVVRHAADGAKYHRTHAVAQDFEGQVWVAAEGEGLRLWRNGRYEPPPFEHPALRYPVRLVEVLADSTLLLSLRGGGLLFCKKNGQFAHLTTRDGLSSDWLSELEFDPEGRIYAASNAGLNILSPRANGRWGVEVVTNKHGLPSDQVNDVAWLDGELWVATDRGVTRFRSKPASALMPAPTLEKLVVNNRPQLYRKDLQLGYQQNNLSLHFSSLHLRSSGDITYRYRLLGADTNFNYTKVRQVNFANLAPSKYAFEVQAQNEDGQWSAATRWSFEVSPAWWATTWFRSLLVVFLMVSAWFYYQNRLRALRREAALQQKMRDLQTAALRAQMNPHFIFNCLASIQNFIVENDAASATRYLARFARLVRLALHGSLDGTHALADEVEMLENYLALEQLRFGGKFEFGVTITPELDATATFLPPMLVQPFVENAILHGMKNKTEGGRVEVLFSKKDQKLVVTVSDNGAGFDPDKNEPADAPHKSVGMALTRNRLGLLSARDDAEAFSQESIRAADGSPAGTRVVLQVPI
jgi:ligand-binding sensor domain-containing protein